MKIIEVVQGTPEWHEWRAGKYSASDAPVVMRASKYKTFNKLVEEVATGEKEEPNAAMLTLFKKGHDAENAIRPHIEDIIGEELFPVCGEMESSPKMAASFDGMTMDGRIIFEHKLWSDERSEHVISGEVPPQDYWQVVDQLLVSDAEKCIFVVSDGTPEKCVYCWMERPTGAEFTALLEGWAEFQRAVDEYAPEAVTIANPAPKDLPALYFKASGSIVECNLETFEKQSLKVIEAINTDLKTDSDFATAKLTVKWCENAETKLKSALEQLLAQVPDIDNARLTVEHLQELVRQTRLKLSKQVKNQEAKIKKQVIDDAHEELTRHESSFGADWPGGVRLPFISVDFSAAGKSKKTLATYKDAVSKLLIEKKLEVSTLAEGIDKKIAQFKTLAENYEFIFADLQQLIEKDEDDFVAAVKIRIAEYDEKTENQESPAQDTVTPVANVQSIVRVPRPSDEAIIEAIAERFHVSYLTAFKWVSELDTAELATQAASA